LKRILIVKLRPLGDAILAGTCFEAVREAFPKAWITALVQPPAHELYRKSGWVNETLAYHRGAMDRKPFLVRVWKEYKLVRALKKRRFDLAIDLSAAHRSAQLVARAKPAITIGLGLPPVKKFYDLSAPAEDELSVPAVELDRRVLGLIGLTPKPHDRPEGYWKVPVEAIQFAHTFWKANKFTKDDMVLAINPFASCVSKEWYADKWAAVIRELLGHGLKLFFTCAPLERAGLERFSRELGKDLPIYSQTSLIPLMGLYKRCAAVVSVDSGPRHLAAAVGTPTLTVWGPEPVNRWHPYSAERHPIVLREVPCRPCGLTVCIEKKHECMVKLEPGTVIHELKHLLKRVTGIQA
jgi:ADP-heptose:LPS heptosyltransferase